MFLAYFIIIKYTFYAYPFICQFSPLGSWLYNSIFKKKFIGKYEQEEEPEILEYPYSFAHRNVADSAHNIAYHTT